jgi:hypothetical protein
MDGPVVGTKYMYPHALSTATDANVCVLKAAAEKVWYVPEVLLPARATFTILICQQSTQVPPPGVLGDHLVCVYAVGVTGAGKHTWMW